MCALNYITEAGVGRRFSAQMVGLHDCYGRNGKWQRVENAFAWRRDPWHLVSGGCRDYNTHFAYVSCLSDPTCFRNWVAVYDTINELLPEAAAVAVVAQPVLTPHPQRIPHAAAQSPSYARNLAWPPHGRKRRSTSSTAVLTCARRGRRRWERLVLVVVPQVLRCGGESPLHAWMT